MIGLGKWEGEINTPFFKGKGVIEIKNENGKYRFVFDLPKKYENVKITYHEITEIGDDTLFIRAEASAFPKRIAQIKVTFKEDKLYGFIRLPIMNGFTVHIKNGKRIK